MKYIALLSLLLSITLPARAELSIFACEPEWAALSEELGGDLITAYSATHGLQDPHFIQARPSLIAKARKSDLLVCTGAELEVGWLPLLQRKSANPAIQDHASGHFLATDYVTLKDIPVTLDRSAGDVHAAGNPHIQTDPRLILTVAAKLSERMQILDPQHQTSYQQRLVDFQQRWRAAITRWEQQAQPLIGFPIVVQHDNWRYLTDWLQLHKVAVLEAKPGVPPTANDLHRVIKQLEQQPAKAIVHASYQPTKSSDWLVDKTQLPKVTLPFTVGGDKQATDLFSVFDITIQRLLHAQQ